MLVIIVCHSTGSFSCTQGHDHHATAAAEQVYIANIHVALHYVTYIVPISLDGEADYSSSS